VLDDCTNQHIHVPNSPGHAGGSAISVMLQAGSSFKVSLLQLPMPGFNDLNVSSFRFQYGCARRSGVCGNSSVATECTSSVASCACMPSRLRVFAPSCLRAFVLVCLAPCGSGGAGGFLVPRAKIKYPFGNPPTGLILVCCSRVYNVVAFIYTHHMTIHY